MNRLNTNQKKLEKLRGIFFQIGLIIAGGITLLAFEWTTPTYISTLDGEIVEELEWDYPYVEPFEIEKEQPKEDKIEAPKVKSEELEIVKDDYKEKEGEKEDEKKDIVVPDLVNLNVKEEVKEDDTPKFGADKMPEYVGGIDKLFKYLSANIKYPEDARRVGIEGKVHVQFVVNKNGEIKDVKILHGVNKWLDEEALRVVKGMPKWEPGKQHGKPVSVYYTLPISFKLKGLI